MKPLVQSLALVLGLLSATETAFAQGFATSPGNSPTNPLGSAPGSRWRNATDRWFIASRLDAGFFFLRPRLSAGYGKPHFRWMGIDTVPILSTSAVGGYLGARVEMGSFEVRSGALYQFSFNRSFLPEQETYGRRDIDILRDQRAQYWLWDSELEVYAPLGPVKVRYEAQPLLSGGFPEDTNLYLDSMWVVIGPGLTLRQRIGFEFFLRGTNIGLTPLAEVIWLDDRDVAVVRAGLQVRWLLSDELQVRTSILPVIKSPDTLGRTGGDVLEVSMRWLWATD